MCRSDQSADIFSYGIVVWELITQEPPKRGVLRDFRVSTPCWACCHNCVRYHCNIAANPTKRTHVRWRHLNDFCMCIIKIHQNNSRHLLPAHVTIARSSWQVKAHVAVLSNQYFLLGLQIPQECPQAVSDMVVACLSQQPSSRPTAQQIINAIETSMADNPA